MTGLDKLRSIGAHKIYEQTHIAKKFVEDILNEKFSSMNKIQFAGFISILEREYGVDLHALNEEYQAKLNTEISKDKEPFIVSAQVSEGEDKKKIMYIAGALIAAGVLLAIFSFSTTHEEKTSLSNQMVETVVAEPSNTTIEEAKVNLDQLGNTSVMQSEYTEEEIDSKPAIEPIHSNKFEIIPRSNLWVGIIDLETFERTQKLTSSPFELAADKDWLLVMGHGFVNFDVNGEELGFKDESKVWFAYENGVLTKLSRKEFKEKNRGKAW